MLYQQANIFQALFNHILKGHGVKDVKIKELLGFDEELTRYLP